MSEAIAPPETRTKEAEQLADRYLALWNEPDPERRPRHGGHARGAGTRRARGAGGNVLRAVGRVRRTQLQAARRRLSAARGGQVPLGRRLAGRRGDGGGARVFPPPARR